MPELRETRKPNRTLRLTRPRRPFRRQGGFIRGEPVEPPDAEIARAGDAFAATIDPFFDIYLEELRKEFGVRHDARNANRSAAIRRARAQATRRHARRMGPQQRIRRAAEFAQEVEARNAATVSRSIESAGVEPEDVDTDGEVEEVTDVMARSLGQLQSDVMGQAAFLESIEQALATEGKPADFEAVGRIMAERRGVATSQARNLANIHLRKFNGDLVQMRFRAAGITEYLWGPTESRQPRKLHNRYRGNVYQWEKPPPGGHPGELWGCKCLAAPVVR